MSKNKFDKKFKHIDELNKFKEEHPEDYSQIKRILITHQNSSIETKDGKYIEFKGSKFVRTQLIIMYILILFIGLITIYNGITNQETQNIVGYIVAIIGFAGLVINIINGKVND